MPPKTCNWNCVYCQLGRTHPLTNTRREYVPAVEVVAEVRARLAEVPADSVDWITLVASGEGTLHRRFGGILRSIKDQAAHPVAVITNGSLLSRAEVREELSVADAVLPTLDAVDETMFRRINRPHRSLSFEEHLHGLEAFSRLRQRGRLFIEVMLIAGLNDDEATLRRLAAILERIDPDEIHLTLPSRCPVEPWVRSPDEKALEAAVGILGERCSLAEGSAAPESTPRVVPADIISVVRRHPLSPRQLFALFPNLSRPEIVQAIQTLEREHLIRRVNRLGETFLLGGDLRFPAADERQTGTTGRESPRALGPPRGGAEAGNARLGG